MPIHRFRCGQCGHEQDELFILSTEDPDKPEESCGGCGAGPEGLKRLMSAPTPVGPIHSNVVQLSSTWSAQVHKGVSKESQGG